MKAIVFDLDGTILDTLKDLAAAVNKGLAAEGLAILPDEDFRLMVGAGARNLVKRAAARSIGCEPEMVAPEQSDTLLKIFYNEYGRCWPNNTRPYPGILAALQQMAAHGFKLAVLSNKPDEFTRHIVGRCFPGDLFQIVHGQMEGWPLKPDPALTLDICRRLGVEPAEAALVGDSGSDMETAVRAGLLPVGVLWGYRDRDELLSNGARHLAAGPADLTELLTGDRL